MAIIPFHIVFLKKPPHGGILRIDVEFSLHDTVVGGLPYYRSIRLPSEHKGYRAEKNGLAGSGLSGNDDKTLRKLYIQRVYQYVIPDMEPAEHRVLFLPVVLFCHPVVDLAALEL